MSRPPHPMDGPRRGPGVSEAGHEALVEGFQRRQAERASKQAAEDAEVLRRLREAEAQGLETTPADVRTAIAREAAMEAQARRDRRAENARRVVGAAALRDARAVAAIGPRRRKRGRSYWTASLFRSRLAEAEAATPEPRSDKRIADHFRPLTTDPDAVGVSPDYLQKLRKRAEQGLLPIE